MTWVASHCVEASWAHVRPHGRCRSGLPAPSLRNLTTLAFLAFHLLVPLRTYLLPDRHITHLGNRWAWQQMSDRGRGF